MSTLRTVLALTFLGGQWLVVAAIEGIPANTSYGRIENV